ncbi:hypothetical protein [Streptomyces zagrosensis]|uniref:Aminoglycoside phosphotransferase n=1 Tax=Streptomyces zagrosensis TaxID=1042984 RepID=A0A7W9Q752_9ACTN|nr:hypothetical protein [Streptomyces zagrosensis]MBB5934868.1 hypothetical protein [Streptomyces zagrosensis]
MSLPGPDPAHTDINPGDFIIGARDTWIVDWSWPTIGAAFIDPACLVVQLVAAGHSSGDAEAWAAWSKGWAQANSVAIDAFARATHRMHQKRADRSLGEAQLCAIAEAARTWFEYRKTLREAKAAAS